MTAANITNLPSAIPTATVTSIVRTGGNLVQAIIPRDYQGVVAIAQAACRGKLCNKFNNDASTVTAIMLSGMEVGLKPMASLRLLYTTPEGQPALLARGMLAVVQASGLLEAWEDRIEGEGDNRRAIVVCKRRGMAAITRSMSRREAKQAGLLNKQNWSKYEDRMLWSRAVSYALNDAFADLLSGFYDPSELGGPVIDETGEILLPPPDEPQEEPAKTTAMISVLVPGDDVPLTYPKTKRGALAAYKEMEKTITDGGYGIVGLNRELLDWMAAKVGMTEEVEAIRAAATEAEIQAEEAEPDEEPDTFVQDFVDGADSDDDDDGDFPGDLPSAGGK